MLYLAENPLGGGQPRIEILVGDQQIVRVVSFDSMIKLVRPDWSGSKCAVTLNDV